MILITSVITNMITKTTMDVIVLDVKNHTSINHTVLIVLFTDIFIEDKLIYLDYNIYYN